MKILKYILYGIGGLLVLFLLVALFLPSHYKVSRSAEFNQPIEKLYPMVADLNNWGSWDPWMAYEPNAKNTVTGTGIGSVRAWEGEIIGKGRMTVEKLEENQKINMKLEFLAPQTAVAQSNWVFEKTDKGVKATWIMEGDSDYPIGRYFGLMMDGMIGKDFEQGLSNLKKKLEK